MVEGFPLIETSDGVCRSFLVGKHPEKRYEVGKAHTATSIVDFMHKHVAVQISKKLINVCRYFLAFIYDCSRFYWIYFMK